MSRIHTLNVRGNVMLPVMRDYFSWSDERTFREVQLFLGSSPQRNDCAQWAKRNISGNTQKMCSACFRSMIYSVKFDASKRLNWLSIQCSFNI